MLNYIPYSSEAGDQVLAEENQANGGGRGTLFVMLLWTGVLVLSWIGIALIMIKRGYFNGA